MIEESRKLFLVQSASQEHGRSTHIRNAQVLKLVNERHEMVTL